MGKTFKDRSGLFKMRQAIFASNVQYNMLRRYVVKEWMQVRDEE